MPFWRVRHRLRAPYSFLLPHPLHPGLLQAIFFPKIPSSCHGSLETALFGMFGLCVLGPALNLSQNSCVFPCLDQAIGKTTIPKHEEWPKKTPMTTDSEESATSRRLIVTSQPKYQRLISCERWLAFLILQL